MDLEGVKPDDVTFLAILGACSSARDLATGSDLHARIVASGIAIDVVVGSALVHFYCKCELLDRAWAIFREIPDPNVLTWTTAIGNSLINLHAKSGRIERALEIFHGMIHRDVISWGSIITALAQSGNGAGVLAMLREMDFEGIKPDAVVFVSAIDACKSSSRLADGRILHARAIASGVHDRIQVANSLLDMYSKCGRLDLAMAVFLALPQRDTIAWNSIVISFAQHGDWIRARELFQAMHLEGMEPSRVTIVSILSACRHAGLLEEARRYFVCMADDHGIDPALLHYGSMIDLFGRAGWLDHAEELVREMPIQPAITSVTALLGSCRIHGDARRASGAAEQAIDLNPESAAGGLALLSNTFAGNA
ncbi:hypothetical protein SELMODRAFT_76943 [Selaginella moellendorffii]|uniref:Pentacotripeptide-repeat region of PRORP domain-containing protein n=1 Tax=Selaginella moellendorffii TaxID=88036 RepID=D8QRW0_SELML|nr:hypothetical protein SELMODRAFT_76943 [Selaginella moellendorffii]